MRIFYKNIFSLALLSLFFISCETNIKIPIKDGTVPKPSPKEKLIAITGFNAYSYFIYKGRTMGYEYELLQRLGEELGVEIEIKISNNLDSMFELLEKGEGDLIAYNLTVTNERKGRVDFTNKLNTTHQVLVQRKPKNWRELTADEIDKRIIKNPINLDQKTIYVRNGSAHKKRLEHLEEEIGGHIKIIEAHDSLSTEDLIELVAKGEIEYTISDENVARLNQAFYTNLDIGTNISFSQKIAWAVRKGNNNFLNKINNWITTFQKDLDYYVIYNRYFKYRSYYKARRESKYFLAENGGISKYDKLIKKYADSINWDWRLLASLIFQESKFKHDVKSWAGALGLMQLLPETGKAHGAENLLDPEQNIRAGADYLTWLDKYWLKYVKNKEERIKFILASYNIGFGHIEDARRLAAKHGANPNIWEENVEQYLLKKSKSKYYNDEVVRNGYCNGKETYTYVKNIIQRYERYLQFI